MGVLLQWHPRDLPLFALLTLRLWWPSQHASGWTGGTLTTWGLPLTPGANHCMALEQPSPSEPQFPHLPDGQRSSREGTRCGGRVGHREKHCDLSGSRASGHSAAPLTRHQLHAPQASRGQYSQERAWSFST